MRRSNRRERLPREEAEAVVEERGEKKKKREETGRSKKRAREGGRKREEQTKDWVSDHR